MAKLGLVTVLFNSDNVLEDFFKSISLQTFKDYHLYIIDNTPNVNTDLLIEEYIIKYPIAAYTHIKNEKNVGVAKGNNDGIKHSINDGCTHTLLLNNDIEILQEDLLKLMFRYSEEANESIIIPKILFHDSGKIWMAGGKFINFKGTNLHVGEGDTDSPKYNLPQYFNYAPTCFMLIKNDVFKVVGLMDEKYFVYYDDTDFVFRAMLKGYKVYYMPNLTVLHKVSSLTGGQESLFSIYYGNRNRLYYIRKNFKGLQYLVAMTVTLTTRVLKYIGYGTDERKQLYKAVGEGLKM